eukprot:366366-Chlamydomonas_euryale.AAC.5
MRRWREAEEERERDKRESEKNSVGLPSPASRAAFGLRTGQARQSSARGPAAAGARTRQYIDKEKD